MLQTATGGLHGQSRHQGFPAHAHTAMQLNGRFSNQPGQVGQIKFDERHFVRVIRQAVSINMLYLIEHQPSGILVGYIHLDCTMTQGLKA